MKYLTPTFTPTAPTLAEDAEGFPVCAAALHVAHNSVRLSEQLVIQVNRASIEIPLTRELLVTQKGDRLYAACFLRDWSGGVMVDLTQDVLLYITGMQSTSEVLEYADKGDLQQVTGRFNVRGVLRSDGEKPKIIMCRVEKTSLNIGPSEEALQQMLGLAAITGNMAVPAPAEGVGDDVSQGMVLKLPDNTTPVHRVFLLVQGTGESDLTAVGETASDMQQQSYAVHSPNVKCLLSEEEFYLDLHGYCSFKTMLQYRLDTDTAFVCVSAWDVPESGRPTATIEYMTKVSADAEDIKKHLLAEWNALTMSQPVEQGEFLINPGTEQYWKRGAKRLKRMSSEAQPSSSGAAVGA